MGQNKNLNIKTEILKNNIFQLLEQFKLPKSLNYYLLKDILSQVEKDYFKTASEEQKVLESQQKNGQTQEKEQE